MKDIKIIVASHKDYDFPSSSMYFPVLVGANSNNSTKIKQKDNVGKNISDKNYSFCELTGLFWAWKNLSYEYLGLVHYRRYFSSKKNKGDKNKRIIEYDEVEQILNDYDIILPKKRKYYIETNESQYLHAHNSIGLYEMYNVVKDLYPDYYEDLNKIMKKRSGHRFNMFIMKKEFADAYCEWVFSILFELEKRIDISNWSKSEQRIFGDLSERLIDVWIEHNNYKYCELKCMFMEKQNWLKKGYNFLLRKLSKGKKK